ncbi:hypothetical protein Y032_0097g3029 [Ancylostoma ceylanicum]|nr:hypothetical protein Y032_0097g3029 [Ancylostoma ceylanicum]
MPVLSDADDELLRLELSVEPRLGPKLGPRLGPNEFELASADTLNMPTQTSTPDQLSDQHTVSSTSINTDRHRTPRLLPPSDSVLRGLVP